MRNLKKILALVLALVMSLSLMTTASAAETTAANDAATLYATAAKVLVGLNVVKGDAENPNDYRPNDDIIRAEAAALIYRVHTGDVEDKQAALHDYAPFDDLAPVQSWATGYISYAQNAGIVKGKSATKFDPLANITGYETLAMTLRALGYGKNGEFEGDQWRQNTAAWAQRIRLFDGISAADQTETRLNQAATRGFVFQVMFNALFKDQMGLSYTTADLYAPLGTTMAGKLDLEKLTGVVMANEYANLEGWTVTAKDTTKFLVNGEKTSRTLSIGTEITDVGESRLAYIQGTKVLDMADSGLNTVKSNAGAKKTLAQVRSGISVDANTGYFRNFDDTEADKSDWIIRYVINAAATHIDENNAEVYDGQYSWYTDSAYAEWVNYLEQNSKNYSGSDYAFGTNARYATVQPHYVDGKIVSYTVTIQPGAVINFIDQDIMQAIFYEADAWVWGDGNNNRSYDLGEVYVGTSRAEDKSDVMSWNQFVKEYIETRKIRDISGAQNGQWLKVIDNDNDGVAEYVLFTQFHMDQVVGKYTKSGTEYLEYNHVDVYEDYVARYIDEVDVDDVVIYTLIDGQALISKAKYDDATIKTVTYRATDVDSTTVETTDGTKYVQSGIHPDAVTMERDLKDIDKGIAFRLYKDAFGYIRHYEPIDGIKYGLLTELYYGTWRNGRYVVSDNLTAELTVGTTETKAAKTSEYAVTNAAGNDFLLDLSIGGQETWTDLAARSGIYAVDTAEARDRLVLQPAMYNLSGIQSRTYNNIFTNARTNVARYIMSDNGVRLIAADETNGVEYIKLVTDKVASGQKLFKYDSGSQQSVDATGNTEYYVVADNGISYFKGAAPEVAKDLINVIYAVAHVTSSDRDGRGYHVADVIVIEAPRYNTKADGLGLIYNNDYQTDRDLGDKNLIALYTGSKEIVQNFIPEQISWGAQYDGYGFYNFYNTAKVGDSTTLSVGAIHTIARDQDTSKKLYEQFGIVAGTLEEAREIYSFGKGYVVIDKSGHTPDEIATGAAHAGHVTFDDWATIAMTTSNTYAILSEYAGTRNFSFTEDEGERTYENLRYGAGQDAFEEQLQLHYNNVMYTGDVRAGDRIIWVGGTNSFAIDLDYTLTTGGKTYVAPQWLQDLYYAILREQNTTVPAVPGDVEAALAAAKTALEAAKKADSATKGETKGLLDTALAALEKLTGVEDAEKAYTAYEWAQLKAAQDDVADALENLDLTVAQNEATAELKKYIAELVAKQDGSKELETALNKVLADAGIDKAETEADVADAMEAAKEAIKEMYLEVVNGDDELYKYDAKIEGVAVEFDDVDELTVTITAPKTNKYEIPLRVLKGVTPTVESYDEEYVKSATITEAPATTKTLDAEYVDYIIKVTLTAQADVEDGVVVEIGILLTNNNEDPKPPVKTATFTLGTKAQGSAQWYWDDPEDPTEKVIIVVTSEAYAVGSEILVEDVINLPQDPTGGENAETDWDIEFLPEDAAHYDYENGVIVVDKEGEITVLAMCYNKDWVTDMAIGDEGDQKYEGGISTNPPDGARMSRVLERPTPAAPATFYTGWISNTKAISSITCNGSSLTENTNYWIVPGTGAHAAEFYVRMTVAFSTSGYDFVIWLKNAGTPSTPTEPTAPALGDNMVKGEEKTEPIVDETTGKEIGSVTTTTFEDPDTGLTVEQKVTETKNDDGTVTSITVMTPSNEKELNLAEMDESHVDEAAEVIANTDLKEVEGGGEIDPEAAYVVAHTIEVTGSSEPEIKPFANFDDENYVIVVEKVEEAEQTLSAETEKAVKWIIRVLLKVTINEDNKIEKNEDCTGTGLEFSISFEQVTKPEEPDTPDPAIAAAKKALEDAITTAEGKTIPTDLPEENKTAAETAKQTLDAAVAMAKAALTATTVEDLEAAKTALETAVKAFDDKMAELGGGTVEDEIPVTFTPDTETVKDASFTIDGKAAVSGDKAKAGNEIVVKATAITEGNKVVVKVNGTAIEGDSFTVKPEDKEIVITVSAASEENTALEDAKNAVIKAADALKAKLDELELTEDELAPVKTAYETLMTAVEDADLEALKAMVDEEGELVAGDKTNALMSAVEAIIAKKEAEALQAARTKVMDAAKALIVANSIDPEDKNFGTTYKSISEALTSLETLVENCEDTKELTAMVVDGALVIEGTSAMQKAAAKLATEIARAAVPAAQAKVKAAVDKLVVDAGLATVAEDTGNVTVNEDKVTVGGEETTVKDVYEAATTAITKCEYLDELSAVLDESGALITKAPEENATALQKAIETLAEVIEVPAARKAVMDAAFKLVSDAGLTKVNATTKKEEIPEGEVKTAYDELKKAVDACERMDVLTGMVSGDALKTNGVSNPVEVNAGVLKEAIDAAVEAADAVEAVRETVLAAIAAYEKGISKDVIKATDVQAKLKALKEAAEADDAKKEDLEKMVTKDGELDDAATDSDAAALKTAIDDAKNVLEAVKKAFGADFFKYSANCSVVANEKTKGDDVIIDMFANAEITNDSKPVAKGEGEGLTNTIVIDGETVSSVVLNMNGNNITIVYPNVQYDASNPTQDNDQYGWGKVAGIKLMAGADLTINGTGTVKVSGWDIHGITVDNSAKGEMSYVVIGEGVTISIGKEGFTDKREGKDVLDYRANCLMVSAGTDETTKALIGALGGANITVKGTLEGSTGYYVNGLFTAANDSSYDAITATFESTAVVDTTFLGMYLPGMATTIINGAEINSGLSGIEISNGTLIINKGSVVGGLTSKSEIEVNPACQGGGQITYGAGIAVTPLAGGVIEVVVKEGAEVNGGEKGQSIAFASRKDDKATSVEVRFGKSTIDPDRPWFAEGLEELYETKTDAYGDIVITYPDAE